MTVKNTEFKEKQIGKNYASVFIRGLKIAPVNGMTVGQMKEVDKLLDKLEAGKKEKTIDLSESEIKTVLEKTRAIAWVQHNKELIEMDDYLESLA